MTPDPGGHVFVTDYGRDFEDFAAGDVYEHRPGRTITESDTIHFSLLTMDRHHAARADGADERGMLVSPSLTLAIVTGLTTDDVTAKAITTPGWDKVKLVSPVFVGDTLLARTKVLECRRSVAPSDQGIVRTYTEGYKQDGTVVISFERISVIPLGA